jgi:hypothetical protein
LSQSRTGSVPVSDFQKAAGSRLGSSSPTRYCTNPGTYDQAPPHRQSCTRSNTCELCRRGNGGVSMTSEDGRTPPRGSFVLRNELLTERTIPGLDASRPSFLWRTSRNQPNERASLNDRPEAKGPRQWQERERRKYERRRRRVQRGHHATLEGRAPISALWVCPCADAS